MHELHRSFQLEMENKRGMFPKKFNVEFIQI